jgi:uncharacterized protein (DUF342 family)
MTHPFVLHNSFEPYLRHAVHEIIAQDNQHYVVDVDRGQREFFVSIYNLPRVERIRAMKTDKIGMPKRHCITYTFFFCSHIC